MVEVIVPMHVTMVSAVGMLVFVLVERDLEPAVKGIGDAAQRCKARQVLAAFKPRNHRLGHPKPNRKLLLGLTILGAQRGKLLRESRG
jgi:hypothetical protein